jgi:hypothetical protein
MWMVLREPGTGNLLMSVYQLNGELLRSGQVRDELGLDIAVSAPVCEVLRGGLLRHIYDLEVTTPESRINLPSQAERAVQSSSAPFSWRIQTGALVNTFRHLADENAPYFDVRWGEFFQFVAWTGPP